MRNTLLLIFLFSFLLLYGQPTRGQSNWERVSELAGGGILADYHEFKGNLVLAYSQSYETENFPNREVFNLMIYDGKKSYMEETREKLAHWKGKVVGIFERNDTLFFIQRKTRESITTATTYWHGVYATHDLKSFTLIDSFKFWRAEHFAVYQDSIFFVGKAHPDSVFDMYRLNEDFSTLTPFNLSIYDAARNGNYGTVENFYIQNNRLVFHGQIFLKCCSGTYVLVYENGKVSFEEDGPKYPFNKATYLNGQLFRTNSSYFFNENIPQKKFMTQTNNEWVAIGRHDFDRCFGGVAHKNYIYFSAIITGDENSNRIIRYNGASFDHFTPDTLNRHAWHTIVFKDELIINGNFSIINSVEVPSLVKHPILNLTNFTPVATNDSITLFEDEFIKIPVTTNDEDDNEDFLITTVITPPKNGTARRNAMEEIEYLPNANWHGQDTVYYSACDRGKACDTARVVIKVLPTKDPPETQSFKDTLDENSYITRNILSTVVHPDGDSVFIQNYSAANGTIQIQQDSSLTYTPHLNYFGQDTVAFSVCDTSNLCDSNLWVLTINDTVIISSVPQLNSSTEMAWELYPNPATHTVSISLSKENLVLNSVEVYSLEGRHISTYPLKNDLTFSVASLPSGVYMVKLNSAQNTIHLPVKLLGVGL